MAKDGLGNELTEGQLVLVTLDSRTLRGHVRAVRPGGLAIPGQQAAITPGLIVIHAEIHVPFNPQNPQALNVVRLVDPEEKSKLADA